MISCSLVCGASLAVEQPHSVVSVENEAALRRGDVLVDLQEQAHTKFVVARIVIDQPPSVVWPIVVNPFEFQGKIMDKMKQVEVLQDLPDQSLLRCKIDPGLFMPKITYTVLSRYTAPMLVEFQRTAGVIKDFRGSWVLQPFGNGTQTLISYSMFVDPGIPVPRWLIREAVKAELPNTLRGVRNRVEQVCHGGGSLNGTSIQAARLQTPDRLISAKAKSISQ
jgi:hypothetical protein